MSSMCGGNKENSIGKCIMLTLMHGIGSDVVWGFMNAVITSTKETCMSACTVTSESVWNFNMGLY